MATVANSGSFKKGCTGNPGGRPALPAEIRALCQSVTVEGVNILTEIMRNKESRDTDRIKACEIILNRAYGAPEQAITGADGGPLTHALVSVSFEK
jgi:hypothetical protein